MKDRPSYLFTCKDNYLNGIRPSNKNSMEMPGYRILVDIAKDHFEHGRLNDFAGYFQEYQYAVNLWTAHLILEFGNPGPDLTKECLEIIERYTDTPLDPTLAREEKEWFDNYNLRHRL